MKKKFVGVLLIVAMTVVTLAGCGGKANVNKNQKFCQIYLMVNKGFGFILIGRICMMD